MFWCKIVDMAVDKSEGKTVFVDDDMRNILREDPFTREWKVDCTPPPIDNSLYADPPVMLFKQYSNHRYDQH